MASWSPKPSENIVYSLPNYKFDYSMKIYAVEQKIVIVESRFIVLV